MKTGTISSSDFVKGNPSKQDYYRKGAKGLGAIHREDIDGYCKCGYITLKPKNRFEEHNGGLTIKRSQVEIHNIFGQICKTLRPKYDKQKDEEEFMLFYSCNACVNDWK